MPEYNLVAGNGHGSHTQYRECLPGRTAMESIYASGGKLFIDGEEQPLDKALAELLPEKPAVKRSH